MAKKEKGPISSAVNLVAWITGVLVSLAVGFGMAQGTLTVPYIQPIVPFAGWIVVILTLVSAVLAIIDKVR